MKTTEIIANTGRCADCGDNVELRPYTSDGRWVCFDCMMKDEKTAKRVFGKILDEGNVIIDARHNAEKPK